VRQPAAALLFMEALQHNGSPAVVGHDRMVAKDSIFKKLN
jgi:hypothetical protein